MDALRYKPTFAINKDDADNTRTCFQALALGILFGTLIGAASLFVQVKKLVGDGCAVDRTRGCHRRGWHAPRPIASDFNGHVSSPRRP